MLYAANMAFAIPIEDVEFVDDEKIGIFIATFDPPSLAHDQLMETALESCGKLIVIPTDFTPHKPFRTATYHRQAMLAAAYADHQQIVTVSPHTVGYPQSRFVINNLRKQRRETISFVLDEDVNSLLNRIVIAWLLPTDERITLSAPTNAQASSAIRNFFKQNPDFFGLTQEGVGNVDEHTLPLLATVKNYIWTQGLYGPQSHKTYLGFAQDAVYIIPSLF